MRRMRHVRGGRGGLVLLLALTTALAASGCGLQIPADPDGTLDRVSEGVLRAGASPRDGLVVTGTAEAVSGPLPDLVERFAATRDADVVWTVGSEEDLVVALEEGRLDVAVGGFTTDTPWSDRVSVTRGIPTEAMGGADAGASAEGSTGESVIVLPLGENALQSALEAFVDERAAR